MITAMPRIAIASADFPELISTFTNKLGMPVLNMSSETVSSLGAALGMCTPKGGSNIELMSPADPEKPLSQSLQGFLDRRGEGHFALMLEAADPDVEAEGLTERGLNVMPKMEGAGGRDVHPNSTHGVLIRVYPNDSVPDPHLGIPEGPDPTGLTGIKRVIIAVRDLEEAVDTYGRKFGLEVTEPVHDDTRGVTSVICTPPKGGIIELVAVADPDKTFAGAIEQHIETKREGIYGLVLGSDNLEHTAAALAANGMKTVDVAGLEDTLQLDAEETFGARFFVSDKD
jgi:catechol 2,3-dioxygenase-like lactoylglutathione lyase family enzyme